ncbi:MAG: class D sortase [Kyrpidia sp.]|nr:class D sortase [Kyrpidia sp.]
MAITKAEGPPRCRKQRSAFLIWTGLILWLASGAALVGYFGWRYAEETLWIGRHPLPAYSPPDRGSGELWPASPDLGAKIGDLTIPSVKMRVPVVQGTDVEQLRLGAGHYPSSALPGQPGNVYLAGHRDTVFSSLRGVQPGDKIILSTPYGNFVYEVTAFQIVPETDVSVLYERTTGQTLTLQTCYPFFYFGFAPDRYLVRARLVASPDRASTQPGRR